MAHTLQDMGMGGTFMKKKFLSLFLAMALALGLAAPALADAMGETRVGFRFGETFYSYDAPASGAGWSYDGDYTMTFNGLNIATPDNPYGDSGYFQLCNLDKPFTFVLTSGTSNSVNTMDSIYKMGKTLEDQPMVTIQGGGSLSCHQLTLGGLTLTDAAITATYFSCFKLTLSGGSITTTGLTVNDSYTLNSGSILVERDEPAFEGFRVYMDDTAAASSLVSQFKDQYGKPLQLKQETFDWGTLTSIYDSAGEYVTYAVWTGGGVTPPTPAKTAYASTQSVKVDGVAVEFQMYALKDEKGNDTNYVKVRDVAYALNGTAAQFNVGWDGAVNLVTGQAYTANGSEMSTPFSGNRSYQDSTAATNVNGSAAALDAILLTDDAGGGYTYYKLRDLGQALGFNVSWSAELGVYIETDKPYEG